MSSLAGRFNIPDASAGSDADAELMSRVARRDRRAQQALAERLVGRVHSVARLLLDDPAEAEDAAQDALMKILQSAASFQPPMGLTAWADRIAVRTSMALARRYQLRSSMVDHPLDPDGLIDGANATQSRAETPRPLEVYLSQLSPERREALVLKYALGYSIDEIVGMTGSPGGTIKNRLVSARRQLRRMINRDALRVEYEEQQEREGSRERRVAS